ncbi:hypothetical protein GW17_00061307, partial [Ensete ventricosum]
LRSGYPSLPELDHGVFSPIQESGRLLLDCSSQEIHVESASKRLVETSVPQRDAIVRSEKRIKMTVGKHESCRGRRRADDDLLKAMKENETMKVELPKKSIKDYKESARFEWELRRMGQVSYEYGYRVTLARFQARYPDLEVDDDPFTGQPEDSLVPMETQPSFDNSILP